jgi:NAD(P)H-dependent FMN reductase
VHKKAGRGYRCGFLLSNDHCGSSRFMQTSAIMKILAVCGGRKGGRTDHLIRRALKSAPVRSRIIYLKIGGPLKEIVEEMLSADGIIFGTPVRWFNVSAEMKELIEEMPESPNFPFEGKVAMFIASCNDDGGQHAINQLVAPLNHMGFIIPPYACVYSNSRMPSRGENRWQEKDVASMGKRLTTFIREYCREVSAS